MRVVDANVLLYAVNESAEHHRDSKRWLEQALGGGDVVGFSWVAMLAFIRVSTHDALLGMPLTPADATEQLDLWLGAPSSRLLNPGPKHLGLLDDLLAHTGAGGNLTNDAHIAALALEHRAEVASYDNDFTRFPGVKWSAPAQLLG